MRKRIASINGGTKIVQTSRHPISREFMVTVSDINQNNICVNTETHAFHSAREAFRCYHNVN